MTSPSAALKRRLEDLIEAGRFGPQGRLPSERRLVDMLSTTRWSLRKVLNLFEAEGRIWRHVGRGTFIGARPVAMNMGLAALCQHTSPAELIEARLLVEPSLAAFAAMRATPAQLSEIGDLARKCKVARSMEDYEIWDERFHQAVAAAAGNGVMEAFFQAINALRKEIVWGWMKRNELRPERRRYFAEQHEKIVAAIRRRDPESARGAMYRHLKSLEAVYADLQKMTVEKAVSAHLEDRRRQA